VTQESIELGGAQAAVERALGHGLTSALVVAGVATHAGTAGRELALRAREGTLAQTGRASRARDARATVEAVQAATGAGIVLTRGTFKALLGGKAADHQTHAP
jgi:hypothetical protein